MGKKYDVFISYSSKDQKVAEGICGYLEKNGTRCFIAYRDILKGVVWAKTIAKAIDDSYMMVTIFSDSFNYSDQVDREIELAAENKIPILTYRITDSDFVGAKKYYLKNRNWIDAFPNPEKEFGTLLESIKKLIPSPQQDINSGKIVPNKKLSSLFEEGMNLLASGKAEEAFPLLVQASNSGDVKASYQLGKLFDHGDVVKTNISMAIHYYEKAFELGDKDAAYRLAMIYERGCYKEKIERDIDKASEWYEKAADKGHPKANKRLGDLLRNYYFILCDDINDAGDILEEAESYYETAIELGELSAKYGLKEVSGFRALYKLLKKRIELWFHQKS